MDRVTDAMDSSESCPSALEFYRLSCVALMQGDYVSALRYLRSGKTAPDDPDQFKAAEMASYFEEASLYILRHVALIDSRQLKQDILSAFMEGE